MAVELELSGLTAIILAGGLGTRLSSVVADRPKVLANVRGRPFLAYLLDQLETYGIRYVVLCTGHSGKQVLSTFGDTYRCLQLVYSQESSPLGTAGALRLALPLIKSDVFLAMNGDSFCEANLRTFWTWHCAQGSNATLLLTRVSDTKRYGRVTVDTDGRVLKFDEKDDNDKPGWINAGIYLIKRQLIQAIPESGTVSLEKEILPAWIGQGLLGFRSKSHFIDIGVPETYKVAEQFFTSLKRP